MVRRWNYDKQRDIRLSFLAVKRIDSATSQQIRQHKVLQNLNALLGTCFIIVAERLEEVFTGSIPLAFAAVKLGQQINISMHTFSHPHLSAALFDDAHDARMRDG